MSPAPLPYPAISDPPNVPGDMAAVAQAIENQAVSAYNGYNSANTLSATSLENRATPIDVQPGGTAAALDSRITALNTAITTWTAGSPSNLSAQTARTTAFGPRQDSHDTTMSTLNGSLSTYESQITQLQSQRPAGLLYSFVGTFALDITALTFIIYQTHSFVSNRYYRVSSTGTVQSTVGNVNQSVSAQWVTTPGTSPSTSGGLVGASYTPMGLTTVAMPFACFGIITGLSGTYTVALSASVSGAGSRGVRLVNYSPFIMEDIGRRYF